MVEICGEKIKCFLHCWITIEKLGSHLSDWMTLSLDVMTVHSADT